MADRLHLPESVRLPSAVTVPQWHLLLALGVDRKRINYWRKQHSFPPSIKEGRSAFVITSDVATWLRLRGCTVDVV